MKRASIVLYANVDCSGAMLLDASRQSASQVLNSNNSEPTYNKDG